MAGKRDGSSNDPVGNDWGGNDGHASIIGSASVVLSGQPVKMFAPQSRARDSSGAVSTSKQT